MSVDERVARSVALEQAYVHDVYEQFYDNPRSRLWPKVQQFLQDLEPGSLVCDIGCGSGKYLNVNTSIYNMGGDKSMRLTELAREKENEVLVLDNLALPYRDESLDAVLSIAVVHHLATTERRICALRELARVLRIGGRIIISVWAMEQSHRKFESQDVLVPWRRPKHLSTPSLELTSTTNTSEDDCCMPPYHAYTQTSDSDSNRSLKLKNFGRKRGKTRHKSRSIDPCRNSSPSSSSLSSPNETCYSFVRRALQKLAGSGRRVSGIHRPWFLDGWSACTKEASRQPQHHQQHYNNCANCDCCECNENIQDLPIELRRIDDVDDALQQQRCRRQTFPSSQLINDITTNLKSKSMTNIKTAENCSNNHNNNNINKSNSNHSNNNDNNSNDNNNNNSNNNSNISSQSDNVKIVNEPTIEADHSKTIKLSKPKLVKQKKSICDDDDDNTENNINNNNNNKSNDNDDDDDEALDQPTDMKIIIRTLPDFNVLHGYNHNNNNTNHHNNINKRNNRGGVFKQHSLNEELMSTERLKEKERVRKNIQKQTSLNDDLIYQRNLNFDTFKETIFSVSSTSKRFQLIKTGFTNKIKNSTTNIEKVTSNSFKNGFVRMFQNWKSSELTTTTIEQQSNDSDNNDNNNIKRTVIIDDKKDSNINSNSNTSGNNSNNNERRPSKEDGSDSSKDSSLQSDTSVDSEDSFASVIFIPKSDPMSPTSLSPGPISPRIKNNNLTSTSSIPNSPRIKQSSCPTSPRIKQMPLTVYPLTKQLSSPKPSTNTDLIVSSTKTSSERDQFKESTTQQPPPPQQQQQQKIKQTLAQKYSVPQIPKFKQTSLNTPKINSTTTTTSTSTTTTSTTTVVDNNDSNSPEKSPIEMSDTRNERLKKIKELLTQKPGFGVRTNNLTTNKTTHYPFVRHSSIATNGRIETIAKPLPKLLSLELFNPETDDKDSDSSCVSSPDSIDSVINVRTDDKRYESITTTKFKFPSPTTPTTKQMTLLEAAADVANTLDEAVDKVIKSSPQSKRNLQSQDVLTIMQRKYPSTDTIPLINNNKNGKNRDNSGPSWDTECHRHLTDFADKLSEKLLKEIDQYQEKNKSLLLSTTSSSSTSLNSIDNINDPYIYRLSEELDDLSKLSAEIQKQNEYLAKLSASDNLFMNKCRKCNKQIDNCSCPTSKTISNNNGNNDNSSNNNKSDSRSTNGNNSNEKSDKKLLVNQNNIEKSSTNESLNNLEKNDDCSSINGKLSISRNSIKMGTSTDSCDSERGSSTNSILSSIATSINFGQSMESTDGSSDKCSGDKDTNSISRYSDDGCGSTASLISCPEWKSIKTTTKLSMNDGDTTTNNIKNNNKDNKAIKKEPSSISLNSDQLLSTSTTTTSTTATTTSLKRRDKSILYSDTSQDSLPSDNTGGEITYHRYYHVFKEGELDQLIEKYVENLHIISSYYDHASWCIIAEKVQVWTI